MGQAFTVLTWPGRPPAPQFFSIRLRINTANKERNPVKKILHVPRESWKAGRAGNREAERMEGRQVTTRRKCGGRLPATLLQCERKWGGNIKNGDREDPSPNKLSKWTSWVWMPAPEEEQEAIPWVLTLNAVCVHVWLSLIPFLLLDLNSRLIICCLCDSRQMKPVSQFSQLLNGHDNKYLFHKAIAKLNEIIHIMTLEICSIPKY